jgi:hypothetical protein
MNEWIQLEPFEFYEYVLDKSIVDKVDVYTVIGKDRYSYHSCGGAILLSYTTTIIDEPSWIIGLSDKKFKEKFKPLLRRKKLLKIKEKI